MPEPEDPARPRGVADASEWADAPFDAPVGEADLWVPTAGPAAVPLPAVAPPPTETPPPRPRSAFEEARLLAAIGERATSLRIRRRTRALGIMSAALVVLLVTAVLRVRSGDDDLATTATSTTVGLSAVTEPLDVLGVDDATTTTVGLPPLISPVTPPFPSTTVVSTTSSRRTTTTVDERPVGDRPDGVPGWTNDETACTEGYELPTDEGPPSADLQLKAKASGVSVRPGNALSLTLVIENTSAAPVTLFYRTPTSRTDAWFLQEPDLAASATLSDGQTVRDPVVVPPGTADDPGTVTMPRTVRAVRCGDTSTDPAPGLPGGSYLLGASLDVSLTPTGPLLPWRSPPIDVEVTT